MSSTSSPCGISRMPPRRNAQAQARALAYVRALDESGRYALCIWPYHCLIGSEGHAVKPALFEALQSRSTVKCPFTNLPTTKTSHWGEGITDEEMANLRWARPTLVVEVAFTEWTRDGNLRHASFVAVRTDKRARDVHREAVG